MTFSRLATATVLFAGFAMPALAQGAAPFPGIASGAAIAGRSGEPTASVQGTAPASTMTQTGVTQARMSPAGATQPAPARAAGAAHTMPATANAGAASAVPDHGQRDAARTASAGLPSSAPVGQTNRRHHDRVASAMRAERTQPPHGAAALDAPR